MKAMVIALLAAFLVPTVGHAWGPEGHDVIANVAYDRLPDNLKAKFDAILAGGQGLEVQYIDDKEKEHICHARSINQLANWPDCVRYGGDYADTYDAHFNDIPYCPKPPAAKPPESACQGTVCATTFLATEIVALKDPATTPFDRAAALAFVVHIVGDLHQPLHMIDNGDRGGNDIHATLNGQRTNLHRIWDGTVVTTAYPSTAEAIQGTETLAEQQAGNWSHPNPSQADIDAWAAESHAVAVEVYDAVVPPLICGSPSGGNHVIGQDYLDRFVPQVRVQLAKAALRLSDVLKDALSAAP